MAAIGLMSSGAVLAKRPYLDSVNSTCGTNYDCGLCNVDPGGGPLDSYDQAFLDSGYDPN